eukprot:scaffold81566_cov47-Attheya_sp.AAC.1
MDFRRKGSTTAVSLKLPISRKVRLPAGIPVGPRLPGSLSKLLRKESGSKSLHPSSLTLPVAYVPGTSYLPARYNCTTDAPGRQRL